MISNSMKEDIKSIKGGKLNSLNVKTVSDKDVEKEESPVVQEVEKVNDTNNSYTQEQDSVLKPTEKISALQVNPNIVVKESFVSAADPEEKNEIKTEDIDKKNIESGESEINQVVINEPIPEVEKNESEYVLENGNNEIVKTDINLENDKKIEENFKDKKSVELVDEEKNDEKMSLKNNKESFKKDRKDFHFKMEDVIEKEGEGIDPEINKELKEVVAKKEEDEKRMKTKKVVQTVSAEKVKKSSKVKIFAVLFPFLFIISAAVYFIYIDKDDNSLENSQNVIESNNEEVVEEIVFEEEEPESEFVPGESVEEEESEESLSIKNDEERLLNLTYLSNFLISYCIDNNIDFPVSENYTKLNEENSVSDFMKKVPAKEGEEFDLIDPKDPEFYYAYKSTDGKSFEFTARIENYEEEDCKDDALKYEGICVTGIYMDEEFVSKIREMAR